jgi:hypothetical protein
MSLKEQIILELESLSESRLAEVLAFIHSARSPSQTLVARENLSAPYLTLNSPSEAMTQRFTKVLPVNEVSDDEAWQAYLASEQERQEVYRSLAS